jgi:hypothetical protein
VNANGIFAERCRWERLKANGNGAMQPERFCECGALVVTGNACHASSHHDCDYAKPTEVIDRIFAIRLAVWCEAKLVTVAIDSPIRTWKPNNLSGVKWIRCFHKSDDA